MSMLELLSEESSWRRFYEYKTSLICPKSDEKELAAFIENRGYLPVCRNIREGRPFPLPEKSVISKQGTGKKRTVYTWPRDENLVMKLLTWLLLREYDPLFAKGLYSFRPGRTAKDAVRFFLRQPGLSACYAYKADISNYFNSIPVENLLPMLKEVLRDDRDLYAFLSGLLLEEKVLDRGRPVSEKKGIMAGTPLSAFYANLYLKDLDAAFASRGIPYARYSDDIIVFAEDAETLRTYAAEITAFLTERGLSVNPSKEAYFSPETGWTFLGFSCRNGVADIAPITVRKLKGKMRRKARALKRWQERNEHTGEQAARAFIRIFNRKLLESPVDHELSWCSWFFSVINTDRSLREIDHYAQECVRFLISGKHNKGRFQVRYEDMKRLGYRNLVHAYYAYRPQGGTTADE